MKNIIKRYVSVFLVLIITLETSISSVRAYDGFFTPDATFYDWLGDFLIQTNYQRIYGEMEGYYKNLGVPDTVAGLLAKATSSEVRFGNALIGGVKLVYDNLAADYRGRLIDFYLQSLDRLSEQYSLPKKDIDDVVKSFDPLFNDNVDTSPDISTGFSSNVNIMYVEDFLVDVLKPLYEEYKGTAFNPDYFNLFLSKVYNYRFISRYKSTYRTTVSTEPLGILHQYYQYFILDSSGFRNVNSSILLNPIDSYTGVSVGCYGYASKRDYKNRDPHYEMSNFGSSPLSTTFSGKLTDVEYYYILYDEPTGLMLNPTQIINNYYTTGPSYSNTVNNYYYEYNSPSETINNYINDSDWFEELLKFLQGNPSGDVYNVTINNYYDYAEPDPDGGDEQPIGGGTVNNYYNTENYYTDNHYNENYNTENIYNENYNTENIYNEYHTHNYFPEGVTDIGFGADTALLIAEMGQLRISIEDAINRNGTKLEDKLLEIIGEFVDFSDGIYERFDAMGILLIYILMTLSFMLVLKVFAWFWNIIWSYLIQVWL